MGGGGGKEEVRWGISLRLVVALHVMAGGLTAKKLCGTVVEGI